ncbi:MAG: helix-turn-helix domain-containing protein [Microbacteriaceae bacterium]
MRGPVQKRELTISEAALVTQKSPHTIYRWVRSGRLQAVETSEGLKVRTDRLLSVAARVRPGRPRVE